MSTPQTSGQIRISPPGARYAYVCLVCYRDGKIYDVAELGLNFTRERPRWFRKYVRDWFKYRGLDSTTVPTIQE